MKKQISVGSLAAALLLSLSFHTVAAPPNTKPHQQAATATFEDAGTSLGSDGGGSYVNGVGGISCVIQTGGNFGFDTQASNGRRIRLDFSAPVGGNPNPLPFPTTSRLVPLFMSTQVVNPITMTFVENGLLGVPEGATWLTQLQCAFTDPDMPDWSFRFRFNAMGSPDTSFLNVTRLDANTWRIETSPGPGIGRLIGSQDTKGKPQPAVDFGLFYMPCSFLVVRQP